MNPVNSNAQIAAGNQASTSSKPEKRRRCVSESDIDNITPLLAKQGSNEFSARDLQDKVIS